MGDQIAIGKEGDVKEEPMTTSDEEDEEDDYKMETPAWVSPKSNQTDNQKDEKVDEEEDEGPTPYKVQRRKDLQAVRIITAPVLRGEQPTPPWTDMSHIQGRFCFQPAVLMIGVEDNRYTSGRVRLGPWLYTEEKHEIGFYPDVPYDPEDLICNDMYFKFCAEDTTEPFDPNAKKDEPPLSPTSTITLMDDEEDQQELIEEESVDNDQENGQIVAEAENRSQESVGERKEAEAGNATGDSDKMGEDEQSSVMEVDQENEVSSNEMTEGNGSGVKEKDGDGVKEGSGSLECDKSKVDAEERQGGEAEEANNASSSSDKENESMEGKDVTNSANLDQTKTVEGIESMEVKEATSTSDGLDETKTSEVNKSVGFKEADGTINLDKAKASEESESMEVIEATGTEDLDKSKVTEEKAKEPSSDDKEETEKPSDDKEDSDSDDDRPQICLRDFSEIIEKDSDEDEDDIQVLEPKAPEPVAKTQTYSRRDQALRRLAEITTIDDRGAYLELVTEVDSDYLLPPKRTYENPKLKKTQTKLTKWLKVQVENNEKQNQQGPGMTTITKVSGPTVIDSPRPTRNMFNPRETNSTVLNSMLQTVQQTYQPPSILSASSISASQLVYGRPVPNAARPRQPVPGLSLISSSNTFSPGTTIIAHTQPLTSMWPQVSQRPGVPGIQGVRSSTSVTSAASGPRAASNAVNVQQPFTTQLLYDPASGFLLCPTNQQVVQQQPVGIQQQPIGMQQQRMSVPANAVRMQNGMIIRPGDPAYNNVRQALGNRSSLEISMAPGPQNRMQLPQRAPAPIRSYAPVQQQQQNMNTMMRPQQVNMSAGTRNQNLMNAQQLQPQRLRAPMQAGPRAQPVRFSPSNIRPVAPQQVSQRAPLRHTAQRFPTDVRPFAPGIRPTVQRNVVPTAVPIPSKAGSAPAPVEAGNVTAGNQKPIPGTVEESETELQNKTFPSLVVQVKTCLQTKPNRQLQTKARTELDAGVKGVLVHTPSKFTEWLMRRGVLKLAHYCEMHPNQAFKLGMYSDSNRQPFSGGYVWTSDCCPDRQISVFSGSLFEGSVYPPGTVLKLMYHWSCQTPANNILQWVKVSSMYLKNFFTLIRAVCISWMHENCPPMGGESKYVEIGVITLGSSAETSRGVKNVNVEILGVFDPATKIIRMKVINSMQAQLFKDKGKGKPDANEQGARAFQILWPLTHWVDKRSILLVDGIIDKALFQELGFRNIQQCNDTQRNVPTNINVMNYLRNLVPKMFSSTLSVLSKSIVQQFLDELSWREIYGNTVLTCYDNLLDHIGTMTKWDLRGESLITRLNKINQNPFVDWSYTKQIRRCPLNTVPLSLRNEPGIRECVKYVMKDEKKQPSLPPPPPVYQPNPPTPIVPAGSSFVPPQKTAQKRKNPDTRDLVANMNYYKDAYEKSAKVHSLQSYYYGSVKGEDNPTPTRLPQNLKCPLCIRTFATNVEICRHLYTHISSVTARGSENSVCKVCLKELPMGVTMQQHTHIAHVMVGVNTACRICEEKFKTEQELVIHMWDLHQRRETPYKCGICNYASSFHFYAIQHHQEKHASEADVLCPFCMKIFNCSSVAQLKHIINHLQSHAQLQRRAKKCPRCVLTFVSDIDLEIHLLQHQSQEPTARWIPYLLPPNETNVKMPMPPLTKTPLVMSIAATAALTMSNSVPPAKKQKTNQQAPPAKKKSTLNATLAVPIDTNEKFGGSKYKILVPTGLAGICVECGEDIGKANHFIGKLVCSKCRYSTACQAAMDIHHEKNHMPNVKTSKPGIKTRQVKQLKEPYMCSCGFTSKLPYQLANHLVACDKNTVYPVQRTPVPTATSTEATVSATPVSVAQTPSKPPEVTAAPTPTTSAPAQQSISPTLGAFNGAMTSFEDILNFEESLASTLDGVSLPPLLSPSAPMSHPALATAPSATITSPARLSSGITNPAPNTAWDTDHWVSGCKK